MKQKMLTLKKKAIKASPDEQLLCMECLLIESMVLVAKIPSIVKKSFYYTLPYFRRFWR
jgi:hypothetical protein